MGNELRQAVLGCDTIATRSASQPHRTVFGKNSDRPSDEAQPLELVPPATHAPGSFVRCQYLTIPQVRQTLGVLGSRPWWLWGFEHGVNEAGVAIGNEAIRTRDEVADAGLLGMDLVRLGLERGATALEATTTIIELLERHGQGGVGALPNHRYHSSFLIADASAVYVLETSGRHWAYRQTTGSVAIGNVVTIEDDWDEISEGLDAHARANGWWWGPKGRKLNFRLALEDETLRSQSEPRYAASCRFIARGDASVQAMMRHLRDHDDGGPVHIPDTPEKPRPRSVCVHPGRTFGSTTASVVVELAADATPPIAWCSMATPCTSVFLPIEVGAMLPDALRTGGVPEDEHSLWWAMRSLQEIVDHDPATLTPPVQEVWAPWEEGLLETTAADPASAARELASRVETVFARRAELVGRLAGAALAR
jgi:secernin